MTEMKTAHWTLADHERILAAALLTLPRDANPVKLLRAGQYVMPKARQKTLAEIKGPLTGPNKARYRRRIEECLDRIGAPHPPPPPPKAAKAKPAKPEHFKWPVYPRKPQVRWTHRELAALARRIEHYRKDPEKAALPWGTLFAMAQEVEMPPDRRRWHKLIRLGDSPSFKDVNRRNYERGMTIAWVLPPFDPDRTTWAPPEVEPAPPPQAEAAAPPPPDWAPTRAIAQAVLEATKPAAAPLALPAPPEGLGEALAALAGPLLRYLDGSLTRMLAEQQQVILAEVDRRIDRIGKAMGAEIAQALMSEVRTGVAGVVHDTLEQELGGPVAPPAAPVEAHGPPPDPLDLPPDPPDDDDAEAMRRAAALNDALIRGAAHEVGHHTLPQYQDAQPKATKPLVDVIGLFPRQQADVKKAINGHADLRFVDPGHPQQWTHRTEHVVIVERGAGALAVERVRKAGVRPVMANGSSSVIHAIEGMLGLAPSAP